DLCIVRETACCEGGDTDGDGLPDLSVRSWYLSFDPRFGSPQPETWKGWDGTIKGNVSYTYSDMTGVSLRCAESGQGSCDAAGRVCPVDGSEWIPIRGRLAARQKLWLPANFRMSAFEEDDSGEADCRKGWDGTIKGNPTASGQKAWLCSNFRFEL